MLSTSQRHAKIFTGAEKSKHHQNIMLKQNFLHILLKYND